MGFPSPAADYAEASLSLDRLCNMSMASVFLFKAANSSLSVGIKKDALLVVNRAINPTEGCIILADILGEFRLVRYRGGHSPYVEDIGKPGTRLTLREDDFLEGQASVCFGVVTHCLNRLWGEEMTAAAIALGP